MPNNLALRMRPKTIDQVIGQKHLVGEGKIIRRMVEANRLSSMILYGPPGIGKTCKKSPRKLNFLVVWCCCLTKSTVLTKPSKIFSCPCLKMVTLL